MASSILAGRSLDADAVHHAAQKVGSMIGDRNLVGLVNNAGIVVSGPLLVTCAFVATHVDGQKR
jgi:hypothetical protein